MDCKNEYSSIHQLLGVTASVLRFGNLLKQWIKHNNTHQVLSVPDAQEISDSEMLWVKEAQLQLVKECIFKCWKNEFNLFF